MSNFEELREAFAAPPNAYRPYQIIHAADAFAMGTAPITLEDKEQQFRATVEHMKAVGLGGAVINIDYSDGLDNAARWDWFVRKFHILRESGMGIWIYDEKGFPSGMAGGETVRGNPEYRAMGLAYVQASVTGPGRVRVETPPAADEVVVCRAYRKSGERLHLDGSIAIEVDPGAREVAWDAPEGAWEVWLAYTEYLVDSASVQAGFLEGNDAYINIMDEAAVAKFIRLTHEQYAKHLGNEIATVEATFTDEPALHTTPGFEGPRQVTVFVPWSRDFREVFGRRNGYDVLAYVPALYRDLGPESMRIRHDFWETVSHRIGETFFRQLRVWCEAHGIHSSGHLLAEEGLLRHLTTQGSLFTALREMNLVGMDLLSSSSEHLFGHPESHHFLAAVYPASVNHTYDRHGLMCEISALMEILERVENWREKGWYKAYMESRQDLPDDFVGIEHITGGAATLCALGVTHFNSYQSKFTGETYRQYGDYIGRLEVLMREAKPGARVAVLYPISSLWANFIPDGKAPESLTQNESILRTQQQTLALARALLERQINFDFVDEDSIKRNPIQNGAMRIGKASYSALLLPPMTYMTAETRDRLLDLQRQGMMVHALAELPSWIQVGNEVRRADWDASLRVADDAASLASKVAGAGYAAVTLSPANDKVLVAHRIRPEGELYLFVNTVQDETALEVKIPKAGRVTLWNPETGEVSTPEGLQTDEDAVRFHLPLKRYTCRAVLIGRK